MSAISNRHKSRNSAQAAGNECPLRKPARHVKKSLLTIYMTIMFDVFSNSIWNGW
jgi:hypothetical protein